MSLAERAKQVYDEDLRQQLELEHRDEFVAIEPTSRTYYLGTTFLDAAMAARQAFPDRMPFVIRIGHEAAFHLGAMEP
jgi:hypothetical protein